MQTQGSERTGRRVVVFGATGNVGTSTIQALRELDEVGSILGVARRASAWSPPGVEWARADVARDQLRPLVRGADAVIQLAWLFQPTRDPVVTWASNVIGTRRLLDAVAAEGVPAIICASSVGAYSPGPKQDRVDERWPTDGWPEAAYTREKAYVERVLDIFEREHPDTRVVRMRPGFIFKPDAASGQRRLFVGPFLPIHPTVAALRLAVPALPGLRFQVLHSEDAGAAYARAAVREVRGAFNLAAEPVVDADLLRSLFGGRPVPVPRAVADAAAATAWRLHIVPSPAGLLEALLHLPLMSTRRAETELGWTPQRSAVDTLRGAIEGLEQGSGMDTEPLAGWRASWLRSLRTGVGSRP